MPNPDGHKLMIAVCSSGKSEFLVDCISSLLEQNPSQGWEIVSLTIVWNGDESSVAESKDLLETELVLKSSLPFPLRDVVEHRKGIPFARNRALSEATNQGADWIFFIDDDCVADPDLLLKITERATVSQAHVVAGGWELRPFGEQSSWLPTRVFGIKHYQIDGRDAEDGESLPTAYTRNVLINLKFVANLPDGFSQFDESLAGTGDSDTRFFFGVSKHDGKIVYAEKASVVERYSGERVTLRWHLRRRIRTTQRKVLRASRTKETVVTWKMILSESLTFLWLFPLAIVLFLPSIVFAPSRRIIGSFALRSAPYFGLVLLAGGVRFHEYAGRFRFVPIWKNTD